MKRPATWILVADSSVARIYSRTSRLEPLEEVAVFSHPESRAQPADMYVDAPGRVIDRLGTGRHAVSPRTELHTLEAQRFAKEIAGHLEKSLQQKAYGSLILMAPPAFLGALRNELHQTVSAAVVGEVPKNLVAQTPADVAEHIPDGR
jgi:protein required for attachment to host cells